MYHECIVHTEHQGDCTMARPDPSTLRIIDPTPVWTYRQFGIDHDAREPMYRVAVEANDGLWRGVASCRELRDTGYFSRVKLQAGERERRRTQAPGSQFIRLSVPEGREYDGPEIVWAPTTAIVSIHPPEKVGVPRFGGDDRSFIWRILLNLYWVAFRRYGWTEWGFAEPADAERILGIT